MNIPSRLKQIANELEQLSIEIAAEKKNLSNTEDKQAAQNLSDDLFEIQSHLRTSMYWLTEAMFGEENKNHD